MKISFLTLLALLALGFSSCDDTLTDVGGSLQPEKDKVEVFTDTFYVDATTVKVDSIYLRTTYGTLGRYSDQSYGSLSADFAAQFYCPKGLLAYEPLEDRVDSVVMRLYIGASIGDTLAPMEVSVYEIDRELQPNYYTNAKPSDFTTRSTLLGHTGYSIYNPSIPDSIREDDSFSPSIDIKFSQEFVDRFYNEYKNNRSTFDNIESFKEFFKGTYVEHTFGIGALATISKTEIHFHYKYESEYEDEEGVMTKDTLSAISALAVTNEVLQVNNIESSGTEELLDPANNIKNSYIKSPAGLFSEVTIPVGEMLSKTQDAQINSLKLSFGVSAPSSVSAVLTPPTYVMLIPKENLVEFFEKGMLPNDTTATFVGSYSSSTFTYSFNNLSKMIEYFRKQYVDVEDLSGITQSMLIVPIYASYTEQYDYYTGGYVSVLDDMSHYFLPSAVSLRKEEIENVGYRLRMSAIWSRYKN
ncbi:MAG: DUF4270 domain-containing protein [Bacteroidales bacterium]